MEIKWKMTVKKNDGDDGDEEEDQKCWCWWRCDDEMWCARIIIIIKGIKQRYVYSSVHSFITFPSHVFVLSSRKHWNCSLFLASFRYLSCCHFVIFWLILSFSFSLLCLYIYNKMNWIANGVYKCTLNGWYCCCRTNDIHAFHLCSHPISCLPSTYCLIHSFYHSNGRRMVLMHRIKLCVKITM